MPRRSAYYLISCFFSAMNDPGHEPSSNCTSLTPTKERAEDLRADDRTSFGRVQQVRVSRMPRKRWEDWERIEDTARIAKDELWAALGRRYSQWSVCPKESSASSESPRRRESTLNGERRLSVEYPSQQTRFVGGSWGHARLYMFSTTGRHMIYVAYVLVGLASCGRRWMWVSIMKMAACDRRESYMSTCGV